MFKILLKILFSAVALLLLMAALALVLLATDFRSYFADSNERYFYSKLSEASKNNKEYILLKDVTNFEWDYVCAIYPYGVEEEYQKERYEKLVGFKFEGEVPYGGHQDGNLKLLFISKTHKSSVAINADRIIDQIITKKSCSQENQKLTLKIDSYGNYKNSYRKGFYKFYHIFDLQPINN